MGHARQVGITEPRHRVRAIGVAKLDGSDVEQEWVTGMKGICGVAVDAMSAS